MVPRERRVVTCPTSNYSDGPDEAGDGLLPSAGEQVSLEDPSLLPFSGSPLFGGQGDPGGSVLGAGGPLSIAVFRSEPGKTGLGQDDLFSESEVPEKERTLSSLLVTSRGEIGEIFPNGLSNTSTTPTPVPGEHGGSNCSAVTPGNEPVVTTRSIRELRLSLDRERLAQALDWMDTGTALGIIVKEARALGLKATSKQVRKARAPDKSLSMVNTWIDGARCLEQFMPERYAQFLRAFILSRPLPPLPSASRLAQIPSHVSGKEEGAARELAISTVMTSRDSKRRRDGVNKARYLDPSRGPVLRRADRTIETLRTMPENLDDLEDLDRLTRIHALAQALANKAEERISALTDPSQDDQP